ncbi:FAD-dependent thymidylate synthase [Candidatus Babeliales bacterium]|nr:FAD-dependent thymidylate synthase [Candidatus Babeliales bacterium]MCF7899064.1 FAD-dependent thymidylate synthase [Candidatus Babeliales bacterium]
METLNDQRKSKFDTLGTNIKHYPYGQKDPYALVELVASTKLCSDTYNIDQMPVLSARVSHASSGKTGQKPDSDLFLMNYLAENKHLSPFEHQSATFKIVTPLFVAREWMRHRTQSYNEVSMRYSSDPVGKFYYPEKWRKQALKNKQSSEGSIEDQAGCTQILKNAYENALSSYKALLEKNVCREQARLVVPVGNYTEFYATANLRNWVAFYKLRIASDAQWEIRQYARCIGDILQKIWPNAWRALSQ